MKPAKNLPYDVPTYSEWFDPQEALTNYISNDMAKDTTAKPFKLIDPSLVKTPITQDKLQNKRTRACLLIRKYYRFGCEQMRYLAGRSRRKELSEKECDLILKLTKPYLKR